MNKSLFQFFAEALSSVFHIADTKIGKSLWTLVRRPGELTNAYMEGRRVPFLQPFRVFLVANVLFFLVVSLTGSSPVTTRLATHIRAQNFFHQPLAERLVEEELQKNDLSFEAYEAVFNRRIETLSKSLVIIMIPIFACALGLLFIRRRKYAVHHLVFSCHAYAFLLVYNFMIATGLLTFGISMFIGPNQSLNSFETLISSFSLSVQVVFIYFGLRRAYRASAWAAIVAAIILGLLIYMILLFYRAVLFFAAFYSL